MKITARCHPAMEPLLPRPVPASDMQPGWLDKLPAQVTTGGRCAPGLRQCDLVTGAIGLGILILLPTDITLQGGEIRWDWDPPMLADADLPRAPVAPYAPERARGAPYTRNRVLIRFVNFWRLEPPAGHALLISHPHGYPDLPFQTLTGRITGSSQREQLHFLAALEPDFEGRIPKGVPIAQINAVPQALTLDAGPTA